LAVGVALGCSPEPAVDDAMDDSLTAGTDAPVVVPRAGTLLLELSQPSLMTALEARGYHVGTHLGAPTSGTNADLAGSSALYGALATDLAADLDAYRANDPKLVTEVSSGTTRILDKGWLRASYAFFELTGVVNRADRLASASCGELRFLYRLRPTFVLAPAGCPERRLRDPAHQRHFARRVREGRGPLASLGRRAERRGLPRLPVE
jgi:hypothetical protein